MLSPSAGNLLLGRQRFLILSVRDRAGMSSMLSLVVLEGGMPAMRLVRPVSRGAVGGTVGVLWEGLQLSVWWHEHLLGECLDLYLLSLLYFDLLSLGNLPFLLGLLVLWDSFWVFQWQYKVV